MTSTIRTCAIWTCAVVTLASALLFGASSGAEARGFRLRLGGFSHARPSPAIATPRHATLIVPVAGLRTDRASASTPTTTGAVDHDADALQLRSVSVADAAKQNALPEAKPVPAIVKVAEPWCRSGRVAGSGQGFCLIN